MSDKKDPLFSGGFKEIESDKKLSDRDKSLKEVLSSRNAQRGFFKRIEEVINMIGGLFKGLMK